MTIRTFIRNRFFNHQSEKSTSFKLRKKRAERIKTLIINCYKKYGKVDIIANSGDIDQ